MKTLRKQIKQVARNFNLKKTMCCTIAEWLKTGNMPLFMYPEKFYKTIWSQDATGWEHILKRKEKSTLITDPKKCKKQEQDEFVWIIFWEHQLLTPL